MRRLPKLSRKAASPGERTLDAPPNACRRQVSPGHALQPLLPKPTALIGYRQMRYHLLLFISIALATVGVPTSIAFAQSEEVIRLVSSKKYDEALKAAHRDLAEAERNRGPDHPDLANALYGIAWLYNIW